MVSRERYNALDALKCICAFLIICIHIPFPGALGEYVVAISRIGVPIFFMISGFFFCNMISKSKEKSTIKKLFCLVVISNFVYFCVFLLRHNFSISEIFSLKSLISFFIFNESPFSGHLWYLSAILYTMIIVCIVDKKIGRNKIYFIIPILLLIDLLFGKYSFLLLKFEVPYILLRNFMFVGIPYFLLGDLIYKYKNKIKNIGSARLVLLILLFIGLNVIERYLLVKYSVNAARDQYICTTLLALVVFMFTLAINDNVKDNSILSVIGKKYSMMIYLLHPLVLKIVVRVFTANSMKYILPIIVFIFTLIISYVYYYLKDKI